MTKLEAIEKTIDFLKTKVDEINQFNHEIGCDKTMNNICLLNQQMQTFIGSLEREVENVKSYNEEFRNCFTGK